MKNKVLIKLFVVSISEEYELYIPVNETIKKVLDLIIKSVYDLSDGCFEKEKKHWLIDAENSNPYLSDEIIRDTNIKNSKKLILI